MATTAKLYSYDFGMTKTYLLATAFVAGNLILPQLAHLVPNGGPTLLPIYFLTLIAAYKYGITVGLLTAVFSPLVNSLLFGMPVATMLTVILTKSILLAFAAGFIAQKTSKISLLNIFIAVLAYQLIGGMAEWLISGSFSAALQDFTMGYPGMLIQIFGGYLMLKALAKV
jgi:hypothetical protein